MDITKFAREKERESKGALSRKLSLLEYRGRRRNNKVATTSLPFRVRMTLARPQLYAVADTLPPRLFARPRATCGQYVHTYTHALLVYTLFARVR